MQHVTATCHRPESYSDTQGAQLVTLYKTQGAQLVTQYNTQGAQLVTSYNTQGAQLLKWKAWHPPGAARGIRMAGGGGVRGEGDVVGGRVMMGSRSSLAPIRQLSHRPLAALRPDGAPCKFAALEHKIRFPSTPHPNSFLSWRKLLIGRGHYNGGC